MSESDDICKQLPAITLEDALKKKEVEDGNKAPLEDALKKKKEVEDGNQVPLEDALKKKVEDGNQVPPLDDELKKEKVELDDTCRKLKEKVEDGSGKLKLKRKKMMKAKNKKKKQEVEDGTQAPVADLLKKEVEDDLRKLLKLKMMKAKKHEVEEEDWRKYLGVLKSAGMFSASVRNPPSLGGHRVWLGTYKSPKVAALAYDRAAYKLHGSQATLNFPDQIRTPSDDHAPNNNNNN